MQGILDIFCVNLQDYLNETSQITFKAPDIPFRHQFWAFRNQT